ncbi:MAG: hypothetical protein R3A47_09470 [Polyangiales bacterium]
MFQFASGASRGSLSFAAALFVAMFSLGYQPTPAAADGTPELMPSIGTGDKLLGLATGAVVYMEIADTTNERLCVYGQTAGGFANVNVYAPGVNPTSGTPMYTGVASFCLDLSARSAGDYSIKLTEDFVSNKAWDFHVCDASMNTCSPSGFAAATKGRVYSYNWQFLGNGTRQTLDSAMNASVYTRVLLNDGLTPKYGVIQTQLRGIAGLATWEISANDTGITGVVPPKSTTIAGHSAARTQKIYLAKPDPNFRAYTSITPTITNASFFADTPANTCNVIEHGENTGTFRFDSNYYGRYRIVCDTDTDGLFEQAGNDDLILIGNAIAGSNAVGWDGTDANGDPITAGTYSCKISVNVGEFHYIARDNEAAFEGIRMFLVPASGIREGLPMFWDDTDIFPSGLVQMYDDKAPAPTSPAAGLNPGNNTAAAWVAHGYNTQGDIDPMNDVLVTGNSRGWGTFVGSTCVTNCTLDGVEDIGDANMVDTWTAYATATSATLEVITVNANADCDMDGRQDFEEACLDGTNPCGCVDAGNATPAMPDTECTAAVPACLIESGYGIGTVCVDDASGTSKDDGCIAGAAQVCDDTGATPVCVPCYDDTMGVDDTCVGGGSLTPVCKVDTNNAANNECVVCVDSASGNGLDDGCLDGVSPVCDPTSALGECVLCYDDNATGNGIDETCGGVGSATPVCLLEPGNPSHNECVVCVDTDGGNGADNGCTDPNAPICDATSIPVCVPCYDDTLGADKSCGGDSEPTPFCKVDGGDASNNACVECLVTDDCDAGVCSANNVCVECNVDDDCTDGVCSVDNVCVQCNTDTDCTDGVCTVGNVCVECDSDDDCADGEACAVGNVCVPANVSCTDDSMCSSPTDQCDPTLGTCVTCYDSITDNTSPDEGCNAMTPHCSTENLSLGECLGCQTDIDCNGGVCTVDNICVECDSDDDCDGGVCTVDNLCIECETDDDCADGEVCTDLSTCEVVDTPCTSDDMCTDSVCNTETGECVACVDSGTDVDNGCTADAPRCEVSNGVALCTPVTTTGSGLAGGALCSVQPTSDQRWTWLITLLAAIVLMRRNLVHRNRRDLE